MTEMGEAEEAWLGALSLLDAVDGLIVQLASSEQRSDERLPAELADALVGAASLSRTFRAMTAQAVAGIRDGGPSAEEGAPPSWSRTHLL